MLSSKNQRNEGPLFRPKTELAFQLFGLFLAGATMAGLAKHLNDDGHSSTRGKRWDDTGVRVILTNPRYIAERCNA